MIHTTHSIRVRYGETDPMKYVYYGNYAEYFEVARVELFRTLGISYDEIERRGIFLPVSEYKIKYIRPGLYDQLLEIHTYIKKTPGVKIEFDYEIYNEDKVEEACTGLLSLVFSGNSQSLGPQLYGVFLVFKKLRMAYSHNLY